jgi:pimeloyl-ACP methyl ester carboxylesterase
VTPERVHRSAYFFDLPGSRNALEQTAKQIVPPNIDQLILRFRQISVPTLIIWGERDSVIPVENAHRFDQDIKTSRLTVSPETGHMPHEERPEQVLKELGDFLRALR